MVPAPTNTITVKSISILESPNECTEDNKELFIITKKFQNFHTVHNLEVTKKNIKDKITTELR